MKKKMKKRLEEDEKWHFKKKSKRKKKKNILEEKNDFGRRNWRKKKRKEGLAIIYNYFLKIKNKPHVSIACCEVMWDEVSQPSSWDGLNKNCLLVVGWLQHNDC